MIIVVLPVVLVVFVVAFVHYQWTSQGTAEGVLAAPAWKTGPLEQRGRETTTAEPVIRSLAAAVFYGAILGFLIGGS